MDIIKDKIIDLILLKNKEMTLKNKIPKIYYIGGGQCGSRSIKEGFHKDICVAHWHCVEYFEKIFKTKLLSENNIDLYDLVIYIGKKYNFHPIIIDSIRENISRGISGYFHRNKRKDFRNNIDTTNEIINYVKKSLIVNEIYNNYTNIMCEKHFQYSIQEKFNPKDKFFFKNFGVLSILLLRFEDIKYWESIMKETIKYKFTLYHLNNNNNTEIIKNIRENIKFSKDFLEKYYKINTHYKFYFTDYELDKYIKKFSK